MKKRKSLYLQKTSIELGKFIARLHHTDMLKEMPVLVEALKYLAKPDLK